MQVEDRRLDLCVHSSATQHYWDMYLQDFAAPREIVWLNGAPGSGKVRCRATAGPAWTEDMEVSHSHLSAERCAYLSRCLQHGCISNGR
jgi:hypothetical protein